jgi:hypothetical protein
MTWKITLCLLGISAFTQTALAQHKEISQNSTASGAENDTVTLGTAYHSEAQGFYSVISVLGTTDDTYGNTEMDLSVGVDMGYSQLANMLDGTLGASLNVPAVTASVGASYAKAHAADNYTGTYTLYASLKPKKRILVPDDDRGFQATQDATSIVNANPGNQFEDIGDEFVSAIEYSSQVMVNLKFEYKKAEDKVKWGGQLEVDWVGTVDASGSLTAVDNSVKRDIKITVSAVQMGGDENRILSVIPNEIIKCTMENPQPCFDIFTNTINYMKTDYINQFTTLNDYNMVKLFTDKYKTSGPGLNVLVPEPANPAANPAKSILTKLAIKSMTENWIESSLDSRRAANLVNYYAAELPASQQNALADIRDDAQANAILWAAAVGYCDDNPFGSYCRARELETQSYVVSYDRQLLEL